MVKETYDFAFRLFICFAEQVNLIKLLELGECPKHVQD